MTIPKEDHWIALLSGGQYFYHDPHNSTVTLDDLASSLSNICRFSGHLPEFYSVAQHLVNTSRIVAPEFAFDALMHDTAESFINDIPTPVKWALPELKMFEQTAEEAMAAKFGFNFPYPPEVKYADTVMLILEKNFVKKEYGPWPQYEEIEREVLADKSLLDKVNLKGWQPCRAKREFLERFEELNSGEYRAAA